MGMARVSLEAIRETRTHVLRALGNCPIRDPRDLSAVASLCEQLPLLIAETEANRALVSEAGLRITAQQREIEETVAGIDSVQEAWIGMKNQRDDLTETLRAIQTRSHGINDHDHRDLVLRLLDIARASDAALNRLTK